MLESNNWQPWINDEQGTANIFFHLHMDAKVDMATEVCVFSLGTESLLGFRGAGKWFASCFPEEDIFFKRVKEIFSCLTYKTATTTKNHQKKPNPATVISELQQMLPTWSLNIMQQSQLAVTHITAVADGRNFLIW